MRIHHELLIQGLANPDLAERTMTWNELLTNVAEEDAPSLGIDLAIRLLIPAFAAFSTAWSST